MPSKIQINAVRNRFLRLLRDYKRACGNLELIGAQAPSDYAQIQRDYNAARDAIVGMFDEMDEELRKRPPIEPQAIGEQKL